MNRLSSYAAVIVCACVVLVAAAAAIGFALGRQWRHVLACMVVLLFAFGVGLRELEEVRRERARRLASPPFTTTRGFPEQPRRPLR